jgi:CheY-like chemotaxis protein
MLHLRGDDLVTMSNLANITILIAEDERPVRMLLRVVLEAAGARVIEGDDGLQALRLLDLHPEVDIVCTDMNMPQLDGLGVITGVRNRRPGLPIVVCSALDLTDGYADVAGSIDGLVQKPFVPGDLVRTLRTALDRSGDPRHAAAS